MVMNNSSPNLIERLYPNGWLRVVFCRGNYSCFFKIAVTNWEFVITAAANTVLLESVDQEGEWTGEIEEGDGFFLILIATIDCAYYCGHFTIFSRAKPPLRYHGQSMRSIRLA